MDKQCMNCKITSNSIENITCVFHVYVCTYMCVLYKYPFLAPLITSEKSLTVINRQLLSMVKYTY